MFSCILCLISNAMAILYKSLTKTQSSDSETQLTYSLLSENLTPPNCTVYSGTGKVASSPAATNNKHMDPIQ